MPVDKKRPDIRTADKAIIANVLFIELNTIEDIFKPFGHKNLIEYYFVYNYLTNILIK